MYPNEKYPSQVLREAVEAIGSLPGVGSRSALRLALHLLGQPAENIRHFAAAVGRLADDVHYCRICQMIADSDTCSICADRTRDARTICVVESVRDVMSIEATGQYHGLYHVLGGIISPMEGIGPKDLEIDSLIERLAQGNIQEVILALPTTMEGDTTNFYIYRRIQNAGVDVRITQIARGVAVGNQIEYTDEITLGRSIVNRTDFKA